MDQAIGVRLCEIKHLSQHYRSANALAQKIGIDQLFRVTRQDANSDISTRVIVTARDKLSGGRFHIDEATGFYPMRGLLQRAGKYPQVSALQAFLAMRFEACRWIMKGRHYPLYSFIHFSQAS